MVTDGGDFNHGPVFPGGTHAPSASPDPKNAEAVIGLFNMNQGMTTPNRNHWNQIMSLPRRYTIGDEGKLKVEPAGDVESVRKDHRQVDTPQKLVANKETVFENISGNAIELIAVIHPMDSKVIELNVLRSPDETEFTRILFHPASGYKLKHGPRRDRKQKAFQHGTLTIDTSRSSTLSEVLGRPPEVAPVLLDKPKGPVTLRVFVDKSIVEVFVNDRQCAAVRVYPGNEDSTGVSLRAIGGNARVISLDAWQMTNVYE